jgi:hypothetical protein
MVALDGVDCQITQVGGAHREGAGRLGGHGHTGAIRPSAHGGAGTHRGPARSASRSAQAALLRHLVADLEEIRQRQRGQRGCRDPGDAWREHQAGVKRARCPQSECPWPPAARGCGWRCRSEPCPAPRRRPADGPSAWRQARPPAKPALKIAVSAAYVGNGGRVCGSALPANASRASLVRPSTLMRQVLPGGRSGSAQVSDQAGAGASRLSDQADAGASRLSDQVDAGASRVSDQAGAGASRISDETAAGASSLPARGLDEAVEWTPTAPCAPRRRMRARPARGAARARSGPPASQCRPPRRIAPGAEGV